MNIESLDIAEVAPQFMEVAFILSLDPLTSGGGIRTYIKYLSTNLLDLGHKVTLISPRSNREKAELNYIPIGSNSPSNLTFVIKLFLKVINANISDDTILCGNRADFIFPFIFLKKGGHKCLIIHGNQYSAVKEKSIIMYRLFSIVEKYTMKRIDYIVYVGNESKRNYENRFKEHVDKVPFTIIPVGVDTNLFNIIDKDRSYSETGLSKDKKIIMSVGRLNKEKRYDIAIESIYLLSQKRQDFRYYIIGDGPEKENIASLIQKYGLEETVFTLGLVEYRKIPLFLNCADVFLLTSDRENGPIVLKEAMATGCPAVSTEVGDAGDIIKKNNGILVPCGDIEGLATALMTSLNSTWDKREIRGSCEKYDWKVISKEFEKDVINHFDNKCCEDKKLFKKNGQEVRVVD